MASFADRLRESYMVPSPLSAIIGSQSRELPSSWHPACVEGGLRTAENDAKTKDNRNNGNSGNNGASSRRLVFVGRLHTSATSPLMKASRDGSKQAPAPVPAPGSKARARGSQKAVPGHHFEVQLYHKLPIHRPQRPLLVYSIVSLIQGFGYPPPGFGKSLNM